jgi:DNA-binding response OmpR family regulator
VREAPIQAIRLDGRRTCALARHEASTCDGVPPSGLRFLVADGDAGMRLWLRIVLRPFRADIREARGGGELLDRLAGDDSYDLVIADVRLLERDRLQASARAHAAVAPFLVMTGLPDERVRRALRSAGAALLTRPFAPVELRAAVALLLDPEPDGPRRGASGAAASY